MRNSIQKEELSKKLAKDLINDNLLSILYFNMGNNNNDFVEVTFTETLHQNKRDKDLVKLYETLGFEGLYVYDIIKEIEEEDDNGNTIKYVDRYYFKFAY